MPRFRIVFLPLLLLTSLAVLPINCHARDAPQYNLDSLCYISTDVVEASLVRHHSGKHIYEDTFTATVLDTLGGNYKIGDTIELPYAQVVLPPQPCSLCILFIARRQFQLNFQDAKAIPPQVSEVLPVDSLNRVHRYFQWYRLFTTPDEAPEDDPNEQSYPRLAEECRSIKSRWAVVGQVRPFLSHPLQQGEYPVALSICGERQPFIAANRGMTDLIGEVIHARLADFRNPALHQSDDLVRQINFISVLEHIICVR